MRTLIRHPLVSAITRSTVTNKTFCHQAIFPLFQMAEAPSAHAGKLPIGQRTAAKGSADEDIEEMLAKLRA